MSEWPITDVARATGLTSRALRHYERIGLLAPSRVAASGYRFYGDAELARLYRILSLRGLGLPLAEIRDAIDDRAALSDTIAAHLALLEEKRERTERQIRDVRRALDAARNGHDMTIDETFAGVDDTRYEAEVRERWGDDAWERSASRRRAMTPAQRGQDDRATAELTARLQAEAESGSEPGSHSFQTLITEHHAWIVRQWGGRRPTRDAYLGLGDLYVDDARFAATYGGAPNAERIRAAMRHWADIHLPV